jgi:TolB protein
MHSRSRVVLAVSACVILGALALVPQSIAKSARPPARASGSVPGNQLIAFSTGFILVDPDLDHPSQVMTVRPDGTGERQLTHVPDGKQAGAPDLSPDGRTIAFVSNVDGNFAVWTMRSDGTRQHRLFGRAGFDFFQPRFSPDGRRLVVTRCNMSFGFLANCDLVLTSSSGRGRHVLVGGGRISGNATFSPDGRRIAFNSDRGGLTSAVWVIGVRGGRAVRLTKPNLEAFWPSWSPDGTHLLISSNCCRPASDVFTIRADGTQLRRLTHVRGGGGAAFASYSPDGRSIVFSSDQLRGPAFDRGDLLVMRRDGSHVRRIVHDQPNAVGADWGRVR